MISGRFPEASLVRHCATPLWLVHGSRFFVLGRRRKWICVGDLVINQLEIYGSKPWDCGVTTKNNHGNSPLSIKQQTQWEMNKIGWTGQLVRFIRIPTSGGLVLWNHMGAIFKDTSNVSWMPHLPNPHHDRFCRIDPCRRYKHRPLQVACFFATQKQLDKNRTRVVGPNKWAESSPTSNTNSPTPSCWYQTQRWSVFNYTFIFQRELETLR